jgi:hypothetical protein
MSNRLPPEADRGSSHHRNAANVQSVYLTVTRGSSILFDRFLAVRAGESHHEVFTVPRATRVYARLQRTTRWRLTMTVAWLWAAQPAPASLVPALLAKD